MYSICCVLSTLGAVIAKLAMIHACLWSSGRSVSFVYPFFDLFNFGCIKFLSLAYMHKINSVHRKCVSLGQIAKIC